MAGLQHRGRLTELVVAVLCALLVLAPSASAHQHCLGCGDKPTVSPGSGTFEGVLVLPGTGGSAQPVGGAAPGSGGSGGGCGGCYSQLVPSCGNGAANCIGAGVDQCLSSGGLPYTVLFFQPPSTTGTPTGYVCLRPGQQPVSVDDITGEVRTFVDELVPRDPQVVVQPAGGALVSVPALVRAEMSTAPVTDDFFTGSGFTVQVTARPVRWEWTFGEGGPRSYAYPGAAYDGTDPTTSGRHVTHTYRTPGTRPVQVTVVWSASYQLPGVGTVEVGEVRRPSEVEQVQVRSARSELVRR